MLGIGLVVAVVLVAASVRVLCAEVIGNLQACGQTCINSLRMEGGALGCPNDNLSCLCGVSNFGFGIRDCAIQACGAEYATTVTQVASSMCATATSSAFPAFLTSSAGVSSTAVYNSTAPASILKTASVASTSASSSLSSFISITTTGPSSFQNASSTSVSTAEAPLTTKTASSSLFSNSPSTSSSSTGLTVAAKAGIGIGVAAGAAALVLVVACALMRRGTNRRRGTMQISDPMKGSGRTYAKDFEHENAELEMQSRRYEDMVPRPSPRHMV